MPPPCHPPTRPALLLPAPQELTRSAVHPVGGQAYLSLDSSDEPFLHGIKFTAMPPTKRFRCGAAGRWWLGCWWRAARAL